MWWYCIIDGEQQGPLTDEQFQALAQQKKLKPADMVWNETMGEQWVEAHTIPGLFGGEAADIPGETPPPIPSEAAAGREYPDPGAVSCTSPFSSAIEYTKAVLFKPFDFGKWFALGVSAWLATLFDQSSSFGGGGGDWYTSLQDLEDAGIEIDPAYILDSLREFWTEWGDEIMLWGTISIAVSLVVWLVGIWLKARGQFMFLHNVVYDTADVKEPWAEYRREGNSFWGWQIFISTMSLVIMALWLVCIAAFIVVPTFKENRIMVSSMAGFILSVIGVGVVTIAFAYMNRFARDFVVPLMLIHRIGVMAAWGRFNAIFRAQTGKFLLYGLFYALLTIGAGVVQSILILITCCIAGCLIMIPYVGAVVLLPFSVFFRTYSAGYLSQYGAEFDVWATGEESEESEVRSE